MTRLNLTSQKIRTRPKKGEEEARTEVEQDTRHLVATVVRIVDGVTTAT